MRYLIYRPVVGQHGVEALSPGDVVRDMNALAGDGWELVQVIERVSTTRKGAA